MAGKLPVAFLVPAVLAAVTAALALKPVASLRKAWAQWRARPIVLRAANGAEAHILPVGAVIQRLFLPDKAGVLGDVVLGFDSVAPYQACPHHSRCRSCSSICAGRHAGAALPDLLTPPSASAGRHLALLRGGGRPVRQPYRWRQVHIGGAGRQRARVPAGHQQWAQPPTRRRAPRSHARPCLAGRGLCGCFNRQLRAALGCCAVLREPELEAGAPRLSHEQRPWWGCAQASTASIRSTGASMRARAAAGRACA